MDANMLRDGIFALRTRRLGTVAECLIKRLVHLGKAGTQYHDLYDDVEKKRVEVKFSCVRTKSRRITEDNVLERIEEALTEQRNLPFDSWRQAEFDSNIQQVKRKQFDVLYYGLFFSDCILVFRINRDEIGSDIGYSDKQHLGNVGEGQFHLKPRTLQFHLDNYLYKQLTYEELLELLGA
jgi:hypothetical protein